MTDQTIMLVLPFDAALELREYLGDRLQEEVQNLVDIRINGFNKDDYAYCLDLIANLLITFNKLEDDFCCSYSEYLLPWDNEDHPDYKAINKRLEELYT